MATITNAWWNNIPEYELEGYWKAEIIDGTPWMLKNTRKNSISVSNYLPRGLDPYLQDISFPQLTLNTKSTTYGLISFEGKTAYEEVTLTCYDDVVGSCKGFFIDWMRTIYDEDADALKSNWRYEAKDIKVYYYRTFPNGKTLQSSTYYMEGCYPKAIADISATEEGGDRKTFNMTLMVQRIYDKTPKVKFERGQKYPI